MKRLLLIALTTMLLIGATSPALAGRYKDPYPDGDPSQLGWEWYGGTKTAAGTSADGPKKSNAYTISADLDKDTQDGGTVYLRGYWDVPQDQYFAGFSYKGAAAGGSPRVSVILTDGSVLYLDPAHCPTAANAAGWYTTDFFRTGASCTIHTTWGVFPGTDAVYNTDGTIADPATSAWANAFESAPSQVVSYGFVIVDFGGPFTLDRVRFGGSVLSEFPKDAVVQQR
jgi:hypothetical protein